MVWLRMSGSADARETSAFPARAPAQAETSMYVAVDWGGRTGSPASPMPSRWESMSSFTDDFTASRVGPATMHPVCTRSDIVVAIPRYGHQTRLGNVFVLTMTPAGTARYHPSSLRIRDSIWNLRES